MTTSQAAAVIGCSRRQIGVLCKKGKLASRKVPTPWGSFCYDISQAEAERYRDAKQPRGWKRGKARK